MKEQFEPKPSIRWEDSDPFRSANSLEEDRARRAWTEKRIEADPVNKERFELRNYIKAVRAEQRERGEIVLNAGYLAEKLYPDFAIPLRDAGTLVKDWPLDQLEEMIKKDIVG